jgi:hypothetical protein
MKCRLNDQVRPVLARFYFHFRSDEEFSEDEEGVELRDAQAAYATAVVSLRDMLAAEVRRGVLTMSAAIEIVDENHLPVRLVTVDQVLKIDRVLRK